MVASIDAHRAEYGVEPICAEVPIAPSTYCKCKARERYHSHLPARARRDGELRVQIERVWRANFCAYGICKTWKHLNREHISVARCTVGRLMRQPGLRGCVRGKGFKTTQRNTIAPRPADLVERQFLATRPNQLWVADCTYVATWHGFVFVAFVVDMYSRMIVGWRVSSSVRTEPVLDALEQALHARSETEGLIHHSDRGSLPRFNGSSQRSLRSHLTSKVFKAVQSYANASEGGTRCGARGWLSLSAQNLVERVGWRTPAERLSRSTVQRGSNRVKFPSRVPVEVCTLGKVLSQQAICIFVGTPLPRTSWITEEDLQSSIDAKLCMLGQFRALVPGQ